MIIFILVLLVGVLMLTFYIWRREADRRANAHKRRMARFEQLMEILKKQNSDKNVQVSDTTGDKQSSEG